MRSRWMIRVFMVPQMDPLMIATMAIHANQGRVARIGTALSMAIPLVARVNVGQDRDLATAA